MMLEGDRLQALIASAGQYLPFMAEMPARAEPEWQAPVDWCEKHIGPDGDHDSRIAAVRALGVDSTWTWIHGNHCRRLFFFKDACKAIEFKLRFG